MKNNKFIILFVAIAVLFFAFLGNAYSDNRHHTADPVVTNIYNAETIVNNTVANESSALASSFSGVDCNMSTDKWHGGASYSRLNAVDAPSGGVCKRWKNVMLKFQAGKAGSTEGAVFSFMTNFE